MKKIFTLAAACLFVLSVSSEGRRPGVTVEANRKFEIVIDGKTCGNDGFINIDHLRNGKHYIQVFEMNRWSFNRKTRKLADASAFFFEMVE